MCDCQTRLDALTNQPTKLITVPDNNYINKVDTVNITTSPSHFVTIVRTMYIFTTSAQLLSKLLAVNVDPNNSTIVNVVSITYITVGKQLEVRMVVGTDNPLNPIAGGNNTDGIYDPTMTNGLQNIQFVKNMQTLGLTYRQVNVIQIYNWELADTQSGIRNASRIPITLLYCAGIDVLSYAIGEPSNILPLELCPCTTNNIYKSGVLLMFIEVQPSDIQHAIDVFESFDAGTFVNTDICNWNPVPIIPYDLPPLPVPQVTNPNIATRVQYTITTKTMEAIINLCNQMSRNDIVSFPGAIGGCLTKNTCNQTYILKFIIGTTDPRNIQSGGAGIPINPDLARSNADQNRTFVNILETLKLSYTQQPIVQVLQVQSQLGTPGQIRIPITALTCAGITQYAQYAAAAPYILPAVFCPCSYFGFTIGVQTAVLEVAPEKLLEAVNVIQAAYDQPQTLCIQ